MRTSALRKIVVRSLCVGVLSLLPVQGHAQYSTQVQLETVSDYSYVSGGSPANDTDANSEGGDFWNAVTAPGTPWVAGSWWYDSAVYDTDFYDQELTGNFLDQGDSYFDYPGTGISMFIGHGFCDDMGVNVACWSQADCPAGSYCPGGTPLGANRTRRCIQQKVRTMWTSSSGSQHNNLVLYGQTYGQTAAKSLAMGEDAASGSFGGAGTNGGANVTIILNSCGFRSAYAGGETAYITAGTHLVMGAAPTNAVNKTNSFNLYGFSDLAQWPARGSTLANLVLTNLYAAMADAWLSPSMVTANVAFSVGGSVLTGVPAEGAHITVSRDSSQYMADWHSYYESWVGSVAEANDATGKFYGRLRWQCNYDCNTYGW